MKARTMFMSAFVLTSSLMAFSQEKVADVLVLDGDYYYGGTMYAKAMVSDIVETQIIVDAQNPSDTYIRITDKSGRKITRFVIYDPSRYQNQFESAHFDYRDSNKLPSPMLLNPGLVENTLNTVHLEWEAIEGASGYEIKSPGLAENITLPADVTSLDIANLDYGTSHQFSVRALHASGNEGYHSDWSGRINMHPNEVGYVTTYERYATPSVISPGERRKDGFKVLLNTACTDESYLENFQVDENNNFIVTALELRSRDGSIVPSKYEHYTITDEEIAQGYIDVTGLPENSPYFVDVVNDNIAAKVDARYNTITITTKGTPGAPILIPHIVNPNDPEDIENGAVGGQFNACRLDTIINNFTADVNMAEGQVFRLEGGKEYYFYGNTSICKGFTLETDPEDLAKGLRAKVYLGGMTKNGASVASNNFMLGRPAESGDGDAQLEIEDVIFRGIDFDCPLAQNCAYEDGATGNYFMNMYSNGLGVTVESIQCLDCTFQHFTRGFIRVQGSRVKKFHKIVVDGCVFYNCGYYQSNGNSYCMFAGDGNSAESNVYENVQFVNNTIYNSPLNSIFTDNNKDLKWGEDIKWNFNVSNNTFINFNTFAASRFIFSLRFVPAGSTFYVHDNLIALTRSEADENRSLYCSGSDIRFVNGDGNATFDFGDNYSVGFEDAHLCDDGIFSANAFSANKNSFGAFPDLCVNGSESLKVRVGANPLHTTDLFTSPNPPAMSPSGPLPTDNGAPASGDIWTALQYKSSSEVTNHEIFTKNVGDQRWKSSDPRNYYSNK